MDNKPVTVTVTLLSKMLEISPRQIQMYVSQGVLPKPKVKGCYDRNGCIGAYMDHKLYGPGSLVAKNFPFFAEQVMERFTYSRELVSKLEAQITKLEAKIKASRQ